MAVNLYNKLALTDNTLISFISKEAENIEEYKEALIKNGIPFLEFTIGKCNIIIPECKYKKMTQAEKNKIFKYFK